MMITQVKNGNEAVRNYKDRLLAAKSLLPPEIGQQDVILAVIRLDPTLDSLAYATRWRNAWYAKVSDPHITDLVEQVVPQFVAVANQTRKRLSRQRLKKVE